MQNAEFNQIVRDYLVEDWGDKTYTPRVLARLWRLVGPISGSEFRYALEQLSLTSHRAPNLAQIKGACQPAIAKAAEDHKRQRMRELAGEKPCLECGNTGWVFAIPLDDWTQEGAFICHCEAAQVMGITTSRGAKHWQPEYAARFFVRRHTMPSALEAKRMMDEGFGAYAAKAKAREIEEVRRRSRKALEESRTEIEITEEEIPF